MIIILLSFLNVVTAQNEQLRFEQISLEQGLSQTTINCFLMDRNGFMWIGTCGGLNRYDGYSFKVYNPEPDNPNSLSHVYIQSIYVDPTDSCHLLWIGAQGGGLNRLDLDTESFTHYLYNPEDANSISSNILYEI